MKRYHWNKGMGRGLLIFFFSTCLSGYTQTVGTSSSYNDPGRLFTVPTTNVLPLGSFTFGGGQAFGKVGSDFFTRIGIGIAPYTEVQFNTQKVIHNFTKKQKISTAFTPAIKLRMPYLGESNSHLPSLSLALRHNFKWMSEDHELEGISYKYEKTWTSLFVFASKTFRWGETPEMSLIMGWKLNSLRIRIMDNNGVKMAPISDEYYNKNMSGPFGGITLRTTKMSWMMIEFEHIPSLPNPIKDGNTLLLEENDIKNIYLVTVGTRYFVKKWLGFDVGVQYRSDQSDIADMSILFGLNLTLSVREDLKIFNKKKAGKSECESYLLEE